MKIPDEKYVILSLAGEHASESFDEIIQRKKNDIQNVGYTFWVENSYKTIPDKIHSFYGLATRNKIDLKCLLYKGSTRDTKNSSKAKEYSVDKKNWLKIDGDLSPITGKISTNSHALVFNNIEHANDLKLNLENYVEYKEEKAIRNYPNASTVCAIKKHDEIMAKNPKNIRDIFAIGTIQKPSSVWLR